MSTSSIDRKRIRALERFHRKWLAPLAAQRLLDRRVAPVRDAAATSYFIRRERPRALEPADFELAFGDREALAGTLDRHWRDTPFADLGSELARLSRLFTGVEQRAEVSQFVYEML
jgi:hypothetical protein